MQSILKKEQKYQIIPFTWPKGYKSDGVHAGLRKNPQKKDMGWLYSKVPAQAAGTYTTNQFQAAPTKLTKQTINKSHQLQAMVMNTAIANSVTGEQGMLDAKKMQQLTADKLDITPDLVGVASTGLIGEPLPMKTIAKGISQLELLDNDYVTSAILTTDKHQKTIAAQVEIGGKTVTISGFCKGSGMIHPKMATMLGFVVTDANIQDGLLQDILSQQVDSTFNQITVDGDTSTNDMVVTLANGLAGNPELTTQSPEYEDFISAYNAVLSELAQDIAADGEGSTKLVEVNVENAATHDDAQKVSKAIVGSNLVKAAIFGEDANWGRIIAAIGQTNAKVDIEHTSVWLNDLELVDNSSSANFDEITMKESLKDNKITILVDLNSGTATGQAWGCDLTYNYVRINATYRS
ncbi:bifunctional glutamate N-acetyltransferase/amino-acid acetyltransferase ArgJ [Companilactobacillus halodurans]|uniref:Arginine biosynthesis bifunctional protein ArgJ n=1 Tax=Companilactobacillus halodurans TaxID=2584183 RepID=A0A5P0ZXN6_9LACO|nr:bifunctional glutamate N-acetyltransferase/amino-acid acetyltransferase ArgJ [Companilactobacillus halodurans]MQS75562.1 bifunctional glutamate N-acetyltransferase/amino-acid acetyltransferase ArgJ [Companilactobacillus halodurans]MQS97809.1 bifunctional glutamate N-acetyltransferase/amino-acid acetyltransferase ArgJ [Companilactobacillus halodurans]